MTAIIKFKKAATLITPIKPIIFNKKKPDKSTPNAPPKVLAKYNEPTALPMLLSYEFTYVTNMGNVAPIKMVGKAKIRKLTRPIIISFSPEVTAPSEAIMVGLKKPNTAMHNSIPMYKERSFMRI